MAKNHSITPRETNRLHEDIFKYTGQVHAITAGLLTDDNLHSLCPEHTSVLIDMVEVLVQDIEAANGKLWEAMGPIGPVEQPAAISSEVA